MRLLSVGEAANDLGNSRNVAPLASAGAAMHRDVARVCMLLRRALSLVADRS
jgi:hypothetical protein